MKSYILFLWRLFDPIYYACTRLRRTENSVFRVRLTRYKGKPILLSDGCTITKNDLLIKIHLHNVRIFKELYHVKNELRKTRLLYREVEQSLPSLAAYIRRHRKNEEIKGVIGITMIDRACTRLGFERTDISSRIYKRIKQLTQLPIYFITAPAPSFKQLKKQQPNYLFMSKDFLLNTYGREIGEP
ncbi:MAG TPA: hypothetical protein VFJ73_00720 [Bacillales bacterium]|nr:hypothetical protein [Bacillales bacterium]